MTDVLLFIRTWGLHRFAECIFCKLFYRLLRFFYSFDAWHASAPYSCREYKRRVVMLASSFRPNIVVDIGCGLGEVIVRIPAARRYGIDSSEAVIKAARRLYGRRAAFLVARLQDANVIKAGIVESQIDLLIMTNWPHGCSIETLRADLMALNALLPTQAILIDTMHPKVLPEPYLAHTIKDLEKLGNVVTTMAGGDGARDLHIVALSQ